MTHISIPSLHIGPFKSRLPIIQGGMGGGLSLSGLASTVIDNGAIGVISSVGVGLKEPDFATNRQEADQRALRNEIAKIQSQGLSPIGVNIMMAFTSSNELMVAAVKAGADILFLGAGLPLKLPQVVLEAWMANQLALVPIVSSARALTILLRAWKNRFNRVPDAIVIEGPLAGGHLGFKLKQINDSAFSLENILKNILSVTQGLKGNNNRPIPIIVGGGIFSGQDIAKMISLGASGVQMATRFVVTQECEAAQEFKDAYIKTQLQDIVIIQSPLGLPGRVIRNEYVNKILQNVKLPVQCNWQCLNTCPRDNASFCLGNALINSKKGFLNQGIIFAGAKAHLIDRMTTVKKLIKELCDDYSKAI